MGNPGSIYAQDKFGWGQQEQGPETQGPEGSWLYTVTIPGYTFTGIETYAPGGGYTEADQLSFNPMSVASAGHGAEAQAVLNHLQDLSAHSYVAPYNVAVIYAGLGEKDQAFSWLNRAYESRSYLLALYLQTDARLDNLHSDPRFAELAKRIGLPPQNSK